jgi:Zn-dependent peptidase ImmA (M78 family)/transcriptional regulator with XRE-family HTH domain
MASGSISKLEHGRLTPSSDDLERLGKALGCTPEFLARGNSVGPSSRPWLRAYADASQRALDRQLSDCQLLVETIEHLDLKTLPDVIPTFRGDLSDEDAIEDFTLDVRASAGLSSADAVPSAIRIAERLGCVVVPMMEELGRHVGLSIRASLIPLICVSRPSIEPSRHVPGDRQRFTVAHELGHLALHASTGSPQTAEQASQIERQANRFAGAFLTPADPFLEDLREAGGRVTLRTLSTLKEHWGVAIKALVMRCRTLGVIDDDHARSLYKQISARGWNKAEPITVPNETAIWLTKALAARFRGPTDPISAGADAVGLSSSHLQRWIDWTPTAPDRAANVVSLADRRRPAQNAAESR